MLVFFSRTIAEGIPVGLRIVDHEGYQCFCVRQADGLCGIAFGDKEYPGRVAFTMLRQLLEGFAKEHEPAWKTAVADNSCPFPALRTTLVEYQSPEKVDTIMRIHSSLAETKDVLVRCASICECLCQCCVL